LWLQVAVARATVVVNVVSIDYRIDFTGVYIVFRKYESISSFFFFFLRDSGDRSSKSIDDPYGVFREHTWAREDDDRMRRDEKSCRWVQIDDVNGPPASRGGWLVGRSKV
jgi:hypothetical protein